MSLSLPALLAGVLVLFSPLSARASEPALPRVVVRSLAELAEAAGQDRREIVLAPGEYEIAGLFTDADIAGRRRRGDFAYLRFAGSGNMFHFRGARIRLDTRLRQRFRPPVHSDEIVISGNDNTLHDLSIECHGEGTSPGGALLRIAGEGNRLYGASLLVKGSEPYGYGDLFGKGGPDVLWHHKHSGVCITGSRTELRDCRLVMRSFGHGYYIQGEASDILFERCRVEGEMRATSDMLAETSGRAFDVDFRTVGVNREGRHRVSPGYRKSLAEDGFRTYNQNRNVVFRDCMAVHMRAGFELRTRGGGRLENCAALGCERGFWVAGGMTLHQCRADARHGPALFVEGDGAVIDLEILPESSEFNVHALAAIHGSGHRIDLRPAGGRERARPLPILLGFAAPAAGEGMSPIKARPARRIWLNNRTRNPVVTGGQARDCEIRSTFPPEETSREEI